MASGAAEADTTILLGGRQVPASEIKVAVYGGGNFGTAMACVLGRKGVQATLVVRKEAVCEQINEHHINPYYQSDLLLPEAVSATLDPEAAFRDADFIFHAVPVQYSRESLTKVAHLLPADVPVVSLAKGIETSSLMMMSELLPEVLGHDRPFAYVSGPSFAAEIVQGMATAVTVASTDRDLALDLMALFTCNNFRALYTSDVVGVEVGGAVKNVIAIAAGMCEGLGLGTNAMAALVTRGCAEMRRLVVRRQRTAIRVRLGPVKLMRSPPPVLFRSSVPAVGARAQVALGGESSTVFGLSGVGDTFGTCFGPLSRNRMVGYRLGQGEPLEEIVSSMSEVAEGVATSLSLAKLLSREVKGYRRDLKYPILFGVAAILEGELTPAEGLKRLMDMPLIHEDHW